MKNETLMMDVNEFASFFELSDSLHGKCFMITGATGLIGSVMIRCLMSLNHHCNTGCRIIAIVRNLEKARQLFPDVPDVIEFRQMALYDLTADSVDDAIDYVVHLASPTASKYFVEQPVETLNTMYAGTLAVLEFARRKGAAMVYASSLEVYGSNDTDEWIDEDFQGFITPVDVRSSYSMGKRVAECLCHAYSQEYGLNVTIARLTQTFGAGISASENRVFAQFARSVVAHQNIVLHTDGQSSKPYCYTTDAISALLYLLLRGESGQAYNVANPDTYISIRSMAELLRDKFNPQIKVVVELDEGRGYAPPTKLRLSTAKLARLGWTPRYGLQEMFTRLIAAIN